jgi:hypothetical protein
VEDAATTGRALVSPFLEHGAPRVTKAGSGSVATAEETRELLSRWGTSFLLSPLGRPSYSGSCEAGIGSWKTRVHHLAARHGRPGGWGDGVTVPPPGSCGTAKERVEKPAADTNVLDWFMVLKKHPHGQK